jgi:hypothetical protein
VHDGILEKADHLFRNDDAGVWIELLQNARRAGASTPHFLHAVGSGIAEHSSLAVHIHMSGDHERCS